MLANRSFTVEIEDGEWVNLYLFEGGVQMCGAMFPVDAWEDAEAQAEKEGHAWIAETAIRH